MNIHLTAIMGFESPDNELWLGFVWPIQELHVEWNRHLEMTILRVVGHRRPLLQPHDVQIVT